jgi:hypothetical protein
MSVVMIMRWEGVSLDQYEQARQLVGWETDTPADARFHIAAHDGQAMRVTDLWDSAEQFQTFAEQRLMPGVAELGLPGEPEIEIYPVHATFAPGYTPTS